MKRFVLAIFMIFSFGFVQAPAEEFYLNLNASNDYAVSAKLWVEDLANDIIHSPELQNFVEGELDALLVEPLIDEGGALPLFGDVALAIHIEDLPNGEFGDADTEKYDIDWAGSWIQIDVIGADAINTPLSVTATGEDHRGWVNLVLNVPMIQADVWLRQPDFPNKITSSYYVHARGKAALYGVSIDLGVYSIGGLITALSEGTGIGLDIEEVDIELGFALDLDPFDCVGYCDSTVLDAEHPDYGFPVSYRTNTNDKSDLLSELLAFIEGAMSVSAARTQLAQAQPYLTTFKITDTTWFTHDRDIWGINEPVKFDLPKEHNGWLDYSFFYRTHGYGDEGLQIPGGVGLDITGTTHTCTVKGTGSPDILPTVPINWMQTNLPGSMVGLGIHRNILNRTLNSIWSSKILCLDLFESPDLQIVLPTVPSQKSVRVALRPSFQDQWGVQQQPTILFPQADTDYVMQLILPNLGFEFSLTENTGVWIPAFDIITAWDIKINLAWVGVTESPNGGTACDNPPFPCRELQIDLKLDGEVKWVNTMNLSGLTPPDLTNAIANVIPMFLGGIYDAGVTVAINTAPTSVSFLDLVIDAIHIGPIDVGSGSRDVFGVYLNIADLDGDGEADKGVLPLIITDMITSLAPPYKEVKSFYIVNHTVVVEYPDPFPAAEPVTLPIQGCGVSGNVETLLLVVGLILWIGIVFRRKED